MNGAAPPVRRAEPDSCREQTHSSGTGSSIRKARAELAAAELAPSLRRGARRYRPQQPILTVVCTDPNTARFSDSTFTRSPVKTPAAAATAAAAAAAAGPAEGASASAGLKKVRRD